MPINSMTGFARTEGQLADARWYWELRSVNGRGLDVRLRLPPGHEALEQPARTKISKHLTRGNVSATLTVQLEASQTAIRLNSENLEQVLAAANVINDKIGSPGITVDAILTARGVLETAEQSEDDDTREARHAAVLDSLATSLDDLKAARADEGRALETILTENIEQIAHLTSEVRSSASQTPQAIAARLEANLQRLHEQTEIKFDSDRLHQEAMLLATKADIAEELDRLQAHVATAREYITAGSPVGRKFDFLIQEFNREANTLCSKSNHIDITRNGLQMKAAIDQLREQVQNVE